MWHYNRANTNAINKSISEFDWQNQLNNISDPNDQVDLLTTILMNIFQISYRIVIKLSNLLILHGIPKTSHMPTECMKRLTSPINKMDTLNVKKIEFKVLKKNTQG